jgi:fatty-acyl-CoA synthase
MSAQSPAERFDTWLGHRVRQTPHSPALTFEGATYTYAELWDAAGRMAGALAEAGAGKGSRIAWLGHNEAAVFTALVACSRLGAAFVPLNRRLAIAELARSLALAEATVLLADADHQPTGDRLRELVEGLHTVATGPPAEGWPPWTGHPPLPADAPADVAADDPLVVMFTSGSEGIPKGVILTHANIWWQGVSTILSRGIAASDVVLIMSPLFHVAGLLGMMPAVWQVGGHLVLLRGFEPDLVFDVIPRHCVTLTSSVTTLVEMLADHSRFDGADLSTLNGIAVGGAPLTERVLGRFARHAVSLFQQYGMTESSVNCSNNDNPNSDPLAVGRPVFFLDLCLVSDDGVHTYHPGDSGQVAIKGAGVFWGYLINGVAAPRTVDAEGWFLTGDLGRVDDEGNLHLLARLTEMIKTGGEKVYPAEVERVLGAHPDVAEVVVVPAPHDRWGQTVVAVVVPKPGTAPTLAELREFAAPSLGRFKLPTALRLVTMIPRTATGKISRREVIQALG